METTKLRELRQRLSTLNEHLRMEMNAHPTDKADRSMHANDA